MHKINLTDNKFITINSFKMKKTLIKKFTAFCIVLLLAATTGCKKDNIQPNLTGTWSHVQQIGSFRNVLTQLDLNADGSGKETITNITTSSSTITSERFFTWETQNNTDLILQESGQSEEKFTFTLDEAQRELTLTDSVTGFSRLYFKNE
jgi:hypothetical protein